MASIVVGCLVRQVWPPLSYLVSYVEVSTSVSGLRKMLWQAVVDPSVSKPEANIETDLMTLRSKSFASLK